MSATACHLVDAASEIGACHGRWHVLVYGGTVAKLTLVIEPPAEDRATVHRTYTSPSTADGCNATGKPGDLRWRWSIGVSPVSNLAAVSEAPAFGTTVRASDGT